MEILNPTQHPSTPDQVAAFEPDGLSVQELLTYTAAVETRRRQRIRSLLVDIVLALETLRRDGASEVSVGEIFDRVTAIREEM